MNDRSVCLQVLKKRYAVLSGICAAMSASCMDGATDAVSTFSGKARSVQTASVPVDKAPMVVENLRVKKLRFEPVAYSVPVKPKRRPTPREKLVVEQVTTVSVNRSIQAFQVARPLPVWGLLVLSKINRTWIQRAQDHFSLGVPNSLEMASVSGLDAQENEMLVQGKKVPTTNISAEHYVVMRFKI